VAESITITRQPQRRIDRDPALNGGVSAAQWSKLLPGVWFYDPGFMSTAACESAITYLDGDEGILRYRGYPIEQLAENSTYLEVAYLLLNGELPTTEQFAAWEREITKHTFIHENVRKRFLEGFHYDAHPMGMLVSAVAALSTFYRSTPRTSSTPSPAQADHPTHRQNAHPGRRRAPLQRGYALRLSRQLPAFTDNFLSMMWKVAEPRFEADPTLTRALDVLFILHADHEQNCSTTAMRSVGSSHADPYSATAAAAAALYGPRHGGSQRGRHPHADRHRVVGQRARVHRIGQGRGTGQRLQGFGHRVYKSYDPRAKIVKKIAYEVFEVTGKNPLLDIALKLEEIALSDEYFTLAPPLSQRRLLLRPDLPGDGLPDRDVHRAVLHPRTAGWLAHWQEMLDQDSKIARPRQLYIGVGVAGLHPDQHREPEGLRIQAGASISPSWTIETHQRARLVEQEPTGQSPAGRRHG
jgi:citrate synthase